MLKSLQGFASLPGGFVCFCCLGLLFFLQSVLYPSGKLRASKLLYYQRLLLCLLLFTIPLEPSLYLF